MSSADILRLPALDAPAAFG